MLSSILERYEGEAKLAESRLAESRKLNFSVSRAASEGRNKFSLATSSDSNKSREFYAMFRQHTYSCVNFLAKRCAAQPINIAEATGFSPAAQRGKHPGVLKEHLPSFLKAGGSMSQYQSLVPIENHPLLELMDRPNPVQSRWEFTYTSVANLELTGLSYWIIGEDEGRIELWAVPTTWLTPKHEKKMFDGYSLKIPGKEGDVQHIDAAAVVRIYLPDPSDPKAAMPPPWSQLMSIRTDHHLQASQKQAFENGIFPNLAIKMGRIGGKPTARRRKLTAEQRKDIMTTIKKLMGGVANYGEPAILDWMIDEIIPITRANREMDWMNSGEQVKRRIFQAYAINPISLGEVIGGNRAQALVAEANVNVNAVNPVLDQHSIALTSRIASLFDDPGQYVAWWEPAIAKDEELTTTRFRIGLERSVVTDDEFRQYMLGLGPLAEAKVSRRALLDNPQAFRTTVDLLNLVGSGTIPEDAASKVLTLFLGNQESHDEFVLDIPPSPPNPPALPPPPEQDQFQRLLALQRSIKSNGKAKRDDVRRHFSDTAKDSEEELAALLAEFFRWTDE